ETQSKGEAGTEVPVLCINGPDLSERCAGGSMESGASQQGRARCGWGHDPTDRGAGNGNAGMAGKHSVGTANQNLPAFSRTARLDSKGQWETTSVGHSNGTGSRGPNGHAVDSGADLRS